MDTSDLNRLVEVLGQEAAIYEDILNISLKKTNIIVEGKVTELENITKLEQSVFLKLSKLEDAREELVKKLSEELGLNGGEVTVSELIESLGSEKSKDLETCRNRILNALDRLRSLNELNSRLIRNSLEYIDFSINLIASADGGSNNYGNSGQVSSTAGKRSFFDMKL